MSMRRLIPIIVLLAAAAVRADVAPDGGEFQVNTFTAGDQSAPEVCADGAGRFTVAWQSGGYFFPDGPDGFRQGIAARRYDATGAALGGEFVVNSYTIGPQRLPAVAASPLGDFVVAWQGGSYGFEQDGSASGVFLQRFSPTGMAVGPERRANTTIVGSQVGPAVAADAAGGFVVVWTSYPSYYGYVGGDGNGAGAFGQRFDGAGLPIGPEFQVNTYTTGTQRLPRVATRPGGGFVVVWESASYYGSQDGDGSGVFGRRFDAAGTPLGDEFQVNSYTTGYQRSPAVAADPGGGFVVAWQSGAYFAGQDGDRDGVFAQRFDAAGAPMGAEFQVNTYTTGGQVAPAVAIDGGGNFTVVWTSSTYGIGEDGDRAGIFGQHFAATGDPLGEQFQVNTYTTGPQFAPRIAASPTGEFVVVWSSGYMLGAGQDGDAGGVFGQRLRTTSATAPPKLHGERLVLRDAPGDVRKRRLALRSRDTAIVVADDAGSDPMLGGATLRVSSPTFDHTYVLPAANWRRRGEAWGYSDRALLSGPIVRLVVRKGRLRISGKGAQLEHALGSNPDPVSVVLRLGASGVRQCLAFGGAAEFQPGRLFRARNAPPPATCR
jgi:hypothetical protein